MYFNRYHDSAKELVLVPLSHSFFYKNSVGKIRPSWRFWRWISVITLHLVFFLSFFIDIQILEGTLNASRLLGFHMIDLFTTMEVFVAEHHIPVNLVIGTATIGVFYLLIGGRTYCGWVCPYSLLADIAEDLHGKLVHKKIIKERRFSPRLRFVFFGLFLALAALSGVIVFESINVVGILSRAIVYGWSLALIWVGLIFVLDVLYAKRAWCSYVCPVGTSYGFLGWVSATRVEWNDACDHCMACHGVCPEPHILELTKGKYDANRAEKGITKETVLSGDCTLCGRCIDVCHSDALHYDFRLTKLL